MESNVTGKNGVYAVHIKMKTKQIRDDYEDWIEELSQVVYRNSYHFLEDPDKLSTERKIFGSYKSC